MWVPSYPFIRIQSPPTPTEDDVAPIPTELHVRNSPNLNRTFTVRRKAAKRILPWDLPIDEIQLALPLPQDEDSPATKRPRLEEPFPTSTDEATTTNDTSHDTAVVLPPPDAAADSDPVVYMHPDAGTTGTSRRWTPEENAKLTSAVLPTRKKKWNKGFKIDWVAVAALVPGRTRNQSYLRWRNHLHPSIDRANGRTTWIEEEEEEGMKFASPQDEDSSATKRPRLEKHFPASLDEATTKNTSHGTAVVFPDAADLDSVMNIHPNATTTETTGHYWSPEEDVKLTSAFANTLKKKWGEEYRIDWVAIAALVPGRTKSQCHNRGWYKTLDSSIDWANKRTGAWTEDENIMLKEAVQKHGGKDWASIAGLVPGRTKTQCNRRWQDALSPSIIDRANRRTGTWTEDEDIKLKNRMQTHGGKDWAAIAALVPGRTRLLCHKRWQDASS
jgi:hypothetical protein